MIAFFLYASISIIMSDKPLISSFYNAWNSFTETNKLPHYTKIHDHDDDTLFRYIDTAVVFVESYIRDTLTSEKYIDIINEFGLSKVLEIHSEYHPEFLRDYRGHAKDLVTTLLLNLINCK